MQSWLSESRENLSHCQQYAKIFIWLKIFLAVVFGLKHIAYLLKYDEGLLLLHQFCKMHLFKRLLLLWHAFQCVVINALLCGYFSRFLPR